MCESTRTTDSPSEKSAQRKVLLLGHSFAERVRKALGSFKYHGVVVYSRGISGGGARDLDRLWDVVNEIKPDIVFIQSGENDIGRRNWSEIVETLTDFAKRLTNIADLKLRVVIGAKFKRYKFKTRITQTEYDFNKKKIDTALRKMCRESRRTSKRIDFYRKFRKNQSRDQYLDDGVHLSQSTQLLWVKSIAKYCNKIKLS